jgi:hypothetical protein
MIRNPEGRITNIEHGIMNIEGYSLLQNSEFDIQYSTCPLMPISDKVVYIVYYNINDKYTASAR